MRAEWIKQLETPCVVVDMRKARKNIEEMQWEADASGCSLRPHIKTHKMPLFAQIQMKCGASGITCAKVSEAEVMAEAGMDDIFIAYPMVGWFRIARALNLARKVRRLILAVDSLEGALALETAAEEENLILEVRLEVDTGAKRTGVLLEDAVALAKEISCMTHLRLSGIYTFKSLVYQGKPTTDGAIAAEEESMLMEELAKEIKKAGVEINEISAGSTPTGIDVARSGKVTEIRPGTYIFKDYMLWKEGAARLEDVAVRIYATVVSTPSKEYAIIDGGTKTFPMDILLDTDPYHYSGYAIVEGNDDLQLRKMNEEHGIITSKSGDTLLKPGDILCLIPIHVCTAVNLQNQLYLYDDEKIWIEPVTARGMLV